VFRCLPEIKASRSSSRGEIKKAEPVLVMSILRFPPHFYHLHSLQSFNLLPAISSSFFAPLVFEWPILPLQGCISSAFSSTPLSLRRCFLMAFQVTHISNGRGFPSGSADLFLLIFFLFVIVSSFDQNTHSSFMTNKESLRPFCRGFIPGHDSPPRSGLWVWH
jgi:hypothetical protein